MLYHGRPVLIKPYQICVSERVWGGGRHMQMGSPVSVFTVKLQLWIRVGACGFLSHRPTAWNHMGVHHVRGWGGGWGGLSSSPPLRFAQNSTYILMKAQYRSITSFKSRRYLHCSALLPSIQPLHPPPPQL